MQSLNQPPVAAVASRSFILATFGEDFANAYNKWRLVLKMRGGLPSRLLGGELARGPGYGLRR